jgi:hypothetical protein
MVLVKNLRSLKVYLNKMKSSTYKMFEFFMLFVFKKFTFFIISNYKNYS